MQVVDIPTTYTQKIIYKMTCYATAQKIPLQGSGIECYIHVHVAQVFVSLKKNPKNKNNPSVGVCVCV